jgi:hypothetical protein
MNLGDFDNSAAKFSDNPLTASLLTSRGFNDSIFLFVNSSNSFLVVGSIEYPWDFKLFSTAWIKNFCAFFSNIIFGSAVLFLVLAMLVPVFL